MIDKFKYNAGTNQSKIPLINQPAILLFLVIFLSSGMILRLFWLQIIQGSFYKKLSDENRIRLVSRAPVRGRLLDKNNKVIADSRLSYTLSIQPRLVNAKRWPLLRKRLSKFLNLSEKELQAQFTKSYRKDPLRIILANNLDTTQVLRFKEQEATLKGAQVDVELLRYYPYGSLASHLIGYTQPITASEFKILSKKGYLIADRIGRIGVEAAYEPHLRGQWGGEMLEVDALGSIQRSLGIKPSVPGKDLQLTIDLVLQQSAEKALADKKAGAIVALDPRTGAIRAMASKPTFDPNFFSQSFTSQKDYDYLFSSPKKPLFNRALNAYDPGSTWKPVTGMAGMETGQFPPEIMLKTTSCIKYGAHCFREHNGKGFGLIGYEDALKFSSNTFFYQVGVGVGSEALYDAAIKLGFNNLTGIELDFEEGKGLVGNKKWATQGRGWSEPGKTPWIPEDIASASIGQAVVQVTPLQLARAYAVFANGGYLITPHLASRGIDWTSMKYRKKVDIKEKTLETLRRGLRAVADSGTGWAITANLPNLPPVAGKTGTAEDSTGGPDHSWFVCFAPYDASEIVIVAFAQNTPGGGSVHALPMARQVLQAWNQLKKSNP